jgi:carbon-monoxide dehydrogenase large subunit/6-hydroxypseudooxynicotine dehydrogenase subunit gamma
MAKMSVDSSGAVRLATGGTSLGQGIETVMAQIAAEQLGMGIESMDVINGDTDGTEYGMGSFASRSTVVGGGAVHGAAMALAERIKRVAGQILEVEPASLELKDGMVLGVGQDLGPLSFGDVARACGPGSRYLADGETPGLTSSFTFEVAHMTYPYGVHVGLVSVDPDTGRVDVLRYLVAYEVGRAINPTLVEGQLIGGLAQGIGGALFEEFQFDESGQPVAASFMDYLLPTAAEMPQVDLIVTEDAPSPGNPLKTKGAGEGGLTAAGGAIANAVRDAIGCRPTFSSLPLRPGFVLSCIPAERFVPEREQEAPIVTAGKRRRKV